MSQESSYLDREALLQRIAAGWEPRFVFFWGHSAGADESIGKACLSQWFPASFVLAGTTYPTAEHYMMAQKARLFGDDDAATLILGCSHPAEAKELGRRVRGFDVHLWGQHRVRIVAEGSYAKFSQNPALGAFLIGTHEHVLVEASPKDTIWGVGLAENDPHVRDPRRWRGLNLLGFALMHARARLLAERVR